jgi:hypothetical protein
MVLGIRQSIADVMHAEGLNFTNEPLPNLDTYRNRIPFNGGVALECDHGLPIYMLTPLGQIELFRTVSIPPGGRDRVFAAVREKFGLEEVLPFIDGIHGRDRGRNWGPYFAVTKDHNGTSLPRPDVSAFNGQPYEVMCREDWRAAETLWNEVKPAANDPAHPSRQAAPATQRARIRSKSPDLSGDGIGRS